MKRNNLAFVQIDAKGNVIPNSIVYRSSMPKNGKWIPIDGNVCCPSTTTTTTTTSTTSTTTTTTTTSGA